jgi:signal transduction histidine kinase
MMASIAPDRPGSPGAESQEEIRQLIVDLRDAAQDGRHLAQRYAELLEKVVEEYCVEFEQRAETVLARMDAQ